MKGRGLIIAAAVMQLIGAAFGLLSALSSLVMMPAIMKSLPDAKAGATAATAMQGVGFVELLFVGLTVWVSIKLIQMRRWAWIVSLVMSCLTGALVLLVLVAGFAGFMMGAHGSHDSHAAMGLGIGEAVIFLMVGAPVFVVIGLLVGGRSAIAAAAAQRA